MTDPSIETARDPDPAHETEYHRPRRDPAFVLLIAMVAGIAVWLAAMPWVPAIARCTMERFQLRTDRFLVWAIQQPIPSMYNFANTVEVRSAAPETQSTRTGQVDLLKDDTLLKRRVVNHFPTRLFTFSNARVRHLYRERQPKWFSLRSSYRGQTVESVYRLDPVEHRGWHALLVETADQGDNR